MKLITGMNDIKNGRWSNSLQIFDKSPSMPSISIRGVHAFGRKVIKFLEIGIEHYLLLVGIFEWLDSR